MSLDDILKVYEGVQFSENIKFTYKMTILKKHFIDLKSEENDIKNNVNTTHFAIDVYNTYIVFEK